MSEKLISVIIPVYNADGYLRDSICSVLHQDYKNIEIIVVNDGSKDNGFSTSIIKEFEGEIRFYEKRNTGLADTLNFAIEKCSGTYIARMDQDDICEKNRISEQVAFMEKNPDVSVCGTYFDYIKNGAFVEAGELPTENEDIEFNMLFTNPLCHPSVMFRANDIKGRWKYDTAAVAEDYELWTRMVGKVKFANIPKILLHYRINEKSITHTKTEKIKQFDVALHKRLLRDEWGINPKKYKDEILNPNYFSNKCSFFVKKNFLLSFYEYLNDICSTNKFELLKMKCSDVGKSLNTIWLRILNISNIGYGMLLYKCDVKKIEKFNTVSKFDLNNLFDCLEKICNSIVCRADKSMKIVLCGAGLRCTNFLKEHNCFETDKTVHLVGVLDNNQRNLFVNEVVIDVCDVKEICRMSYDYVLITSNKYYGELHEDLLNCDVSEEKIFSLDVFTNFYCV